MIQKIRGLTAKKTFRDLFIVFVEQALSKAFVFFTMVIIARTLGPGGFGVYSLVTVSVFFVAAFFDFGFENTAVRFASHHGGARDKIYGLYVALKTVILAFVGLLTVVAPGVIATLVNEQGAQQYVRIIYWGTVTESLLLIITSYWQTKEAFVTRAIINAGVYAVRFACIGCMIALKQFDIRTITLFYVVSSVPFLIAHAKYFARFVTALRGSFPGNLLREIARYETWILIGAVPIIIMTKLDFYVVAYRLSVADAGLYNAAVQITAMLSIFMLAARNVFLPKISKIKSREEFLTYIGRVNKFMLFMAAVALACLPFVKALIAFVLGSAYAASAPVVYILMFSFLFTLWNVLLSIVYYSIGNTRLMAIGAYGQMFIFLAVTNMFIPAMGMYGAALSKCVSDIAYLAFVLYFVYRILPREYEVATV